MALNSKWWLAVAIGILVVLMILHYVTDPHAMVLHNVYRRAAYIPILIAAFSDGLRGGLLTAALATISYVPHAFFMIHHRDPTPDTDKALEIVLYLVIGGLTGWLVNRSRQARRELEQSLHERNALEEQLVRAGRMSALGQMMAGLAHEVRNPLASIMGGAETLAADFDERHRKHRIAQLLLKEVDRLNRVVSDFVRFAKPADPMPRDIDLLGVADEVRQLTAAEAASQGVEVSVEKTSGAPVCADPDQLSQVVLNLMLNAFQALKDRIEDKRVSVKHRRKDVAGTVYECVGIADNGAGIPDELQESVFDPYFTTRAEGTGLGLSVSNRIVDKHGGFIDVESGDDSTTFWVCLRSGKAR